MMKEVMGQFKKNKGQITEDKSGMKKKVIELDTAKEVVSLLGEVVSVVAAVVALVVKKDD